MRWQAPVSHHWGCDASTASSAPFDFVHPSPKVPHHVVRGRERQGPSDSRGARPRPGVRPISVPSIHARTEPAGAPDTVAGLESAARQMVDAHRTSSSSECHLANGLLRHRSEDLALGVALAPPARSSEAGIEVGLGELEHPGQLAGVQELLRCASAHVLDRRSEPSVGRVRIQDPMEVRKDGSHL
jgi:hypothetical protein